MNTLQQALARKPILISDGAWGTQLSTRGLGPGDCPEAWNLDRPDDIRSIAAAYVAAGSDIILTNTFGGNRLKLAKANLADRTAQINREGAKLSKQAAGDAALVFASIGPTGEFMQPLGLVSEDEMVACFAEQAAALAEGGADGIVIETMADLGEAKAAIAAARQVCSLPVVACMTFERGPRGFATIMGTRPEQAAQELAGAGADAVGSNCGSGIVNMIEVARLMRPATNLPLWIKPNAGLPQLVGGQTVFRETPDEFAGFFPELIAAGATIAGGCCGTTPDHIRALVAKRFELHDR